MKWRYLAIIAAAVLLALLAIDISVYVYRWPSNGGIQFDTSLGCIAVEVYGNPGPYGGWDRGACDL